MAKRPDTIIKNRREETRVLIEVARTADVNIIEQEAEKKLHTVVYVYMFICLYVYINICHIVSTFDHLL